MFLSLLLMTAPLAPASDPDPAPVALVAPVVDPDPAPVVRPEPEEPEEKPLTYAEAVARSMKEGKPLVVWVGGNFCERCVRESADSFVHYFTKEFEGVVKSPSIVVGVPDDDGLLHRVGEVTWWIEGDREFGHIPSVRGVIRRWLDARAARRQARPAAVNVAVQQPAPVVMPAVQVFRAGDRIEVSGAKDGRAVVRVLRANATQAEVDEAVRAVTAEVAPWMLPPPPPPPQVVQPAVVQRPAQVSFRPAVRVRASGC